MKPKHPVVKRVQAVTRSRSVKSRAGKDLSYLGQRGGTRSGITSIKDTGNPWHSRNILAKTIKRLREYAPDMLKEKLESSRPPSYKSNVKKFIQKRKAIDKKRRKIGLGFRSDSRSLEAISLRKLRNVNRMYGPPSSKRGLKSATVNKATWERTPSLEKMRWGRPR